MLTRTSERQGAGRDFPWDQRRAHAGHYRTFQKLLRIHELTLAWLAELKIERKPYAMERGLSPELSEMVPLLESLEGTQAIQLEALLDDTSPDDVLGRLEHAVWAAHAFSWNAIDQRTPAASLRAITATLEQAAWRLGRRTAEERWPESTFQAGIEGGLPDLRRLALAAIDSPLLGDSGVLTERAVREEVRLSLSRCPHHSPYPEVRALGDALCGFQFHWLRGFAYGLNPRALVSRDEPKEGHCRLRWTLLVNPAQ